MSYEVTLKVDKDCDEIFDAFMVEKGNFNRSSFDISKEDGAVLFYVKALDATALKATLNSIIKLLIVYEKVE